MVSIYSRLMPLGPISLGLLLLASLVPQGVCNRQPDAEHLTAIVGESVILNCPVSQPETPYIIQWKRDYQKIPIYIWYDGYDPHVEESYKGRASRVNHDTKYGLASLNLTAVKENDGGWYECNVFYLDRSGAANNGTWVHLDIHAPPRFVTTPDEVTYVNIGDSIILSCVAEATPKAEMMWFRDSNPVKPSDTVGIFNDGTELRINKIRDKDIGDYLCVARNNEGRVVHEAKVVTAGGAVIFSPPQNLTLQEGEKAEFNCEAKALPGNVTVTWKRDGVSISSLSWLDTRSITRRDGTLLINPVSPEDMGLFTCEVSNGIGATQRASAYLNVEYPARVTYTPSVQYLPMRQQGIVRCYIKSNPPLQFVTWIKDKRLFNPDVEEGIIKLENGSLLFSQAHRGHQGLYTCTPYNRHTTSGASGDMEVLVREPPGFDPRPKPQYYAQLGKEVTLVCGGKGTPEPSVTWRRRDGQNLPRERTIIMGGNITIDNLKKSDHAFYECEVKNEILGVVAASQLLVEGTTPHPPYNITTVTKPFSVKLSWLPGYPGGRDWEQKYTIWFRILGSKTWSQIDVKPEGHTTVTINNLLPDSTYEFQVQGKNDLGDGMFSDIITATTEAKGDMGGGSGPNFVPPDSGSKPSSPTDKAQNDNYTEGSISLPLGPKPAPPRNVTVTAFKDGVLIAWEPPGDLTVPVIYYDIEYRTTSGSGKYKNLNKKPITGETQYLVKKLASGRTYKFRVFAKTLTSFQTSSEIEFKFPAQNKEKAVTAALVGGFLFFTVAIILSVCTVKICNRRKKKKQEKEMRSHIFYDTAYNAVACRASEVRNGGQQGASPLPLKSKRKEGPPEAISTEPI